MMQEKAATFRAITSIEKRLSAVNLEQIDKKKGKPAKGLPFPFDFFDKL